MSTLEKIRAEIDVIEINGQVDEHTAFIRTGEHVKQMALEIIDKYEVKYVSKRKGGEQMSTLEKIKAEMHATAEMHEDGDYYLRDEWVDEIIDKYAEQEPTVQDKQAKSEKYQKAFDDGYANGYEQARFDYEQEPCDKCVYSTKDGYCQYDDITETIPPFEPCDDVVSRQAVLDCLTVTKIKMFDVTLRAREEIKKLPSVTQKLGKWEDLHRCWVCSECGQETHIEHKYCPNCGAKMESEDKE